MGTNYTELSYQQLQSDIETIRECKRKMQAIFDDFGRAMQLASSEDNFMGDASETFGSKYNTLKTRFDNYTALVEEFIAAYTGASEATAAADAKMAGESETLRV